MDRDEAARYLESAMNRFRAEDYQQLAARIGNDEYLEVVAESGTAYQIEIQFVWDDELLGDVRVLGGIDDGSLRGAFRPVCEDIVSRRPAD